VEGGFRQRGDAERTRCPANLAFRACAVKLVSSQVCPISWWAQRVVPAEGPGQGMKAGGLRGTCRRCPALPGVCCVMPMLATAHYYSRYEFEVSQRVPKVIMGRHQRCPPLLVAPDLPCGKDDDNNGEKSCVLATGHCGRALSRLQMEQWLDLCMRRFFGWERDPRDIGNKGEGFWLSSPCLSLPTSAPATL